MTAKEFFRNQPYPSDLYVNPDKPHFNYFDLIRFAEAYHEHEFKDIKKVIINKLKKNNNET